MDLRPVENSIYKISYNKVVDHIIQSWEWGEFRKKLGLPLLRYGFFEHQKLNLAFTLTLHKIPFLPYNFGYFPKGPFPDKVVVDALEKLGKQHHCIAIKLEPHIKVNHSDKVDPRLKRSPHPHFHKHSRIIDLTLSESEILGKMHPKTRYNIKIAQKHRVWVEERTDPEGFEIYLKLYFETTKRQNYYGHDPNYHKVAWEELRKSDLARVLIAFYVPEGQTIAIPLAAWMFFNFKDTLYYPYGGSATEYKNVQAPTLLAWEAIKMGKRMNLKQFDLWGSLPPESSLDHPWFGFSQFKERLGADPIEYIGSYDLVFNSPLYTLFNFFDKSAPLKSFLLKLIGR